jgi:diacylglycerol O-acyltransferase
MRQFTSLDAQFIAAEDGRVHGHVAGLAIYDPSTAPGGKLGFDEVKQQIGSRLHLLPPFQQRMIKVPFGIDLPYWADDPDFDLDRHFHSYTLEAPGDDTQLAEVVGRILGTPLDLSRPPWAVHVIEGLSDGRVAIATAMHHAACDGIGMAMIFAIMHDPTPEVRKFGPAIVKIEPQPSRLGMLARGVVGLPRQPLRFAKSLPRALPHLDQVVTLRPLPGVPQLASLARHLLLSTESKVAVDGTMLAERQTLAPRTATTSKVGPNRTVAFGTTSLAEIKAVKNRFGVTVNDVVMAIIAGGLRAWMERRGELPKQPLAAMVPISVRAADGSDLFGDGGGPFGNRIAMMIPPVYTNVKYPADRLALTSRAMLSAKERHQAVPATLLQDANHFIPPMLLARAARASAMVATSSHRGVAANLLISNIPGSREPQYFAGARLTAHFPLSAIFHGMGLNITVVSYTDQVDWGIAGDPEQIGDAAELLGDLLAAQQELVDLEASFDEDAAVAAATEA